MSFERDEHDGPIEVSRPSDGRVMVTVTDYGDRRCICMSDFNAARILAGLSLRYTRQHDVTAPLPRQSEEPK